MPTNFPFFNFYHFPNHVFFVSLSTMFLVFLYIFNYFSFGFVTFSTIHFLIQVDLAVDLIANEALRNKSYSIN